MNEDVTLTMDVPTTVDPLDFPVEDIKPIFTQTAEDTGEEDQVVTV